MNSKTVEYVKQYNLKYYEKNKEYFSNYYQANREKLTNKIECIFCKSVVSRMCLSRHQKTNKCLKKQFSDNNIV